MGSDPVEINGILAIPTPAEITGFEISIAQPRRQRSSWCRAATAILDCVTDDASKGRNICGVECAWFDSWF
jgi:hypothetical protein